MILLFAEPRTLHRPSPLVNGSELTQHGNPEMDADERRDWHYIAQGKPQQNAPVESFIGGLRESLAW